jgi:hypothetical protein
MTHGSAGNPSCFCGACNAVPALSRRQFLCTAAATAVVVWVLDLKFLWEFAAYS